MRGDRAGKVLQTEAAPFSMRQTICHEANEINRESGRRDQPPGHSHHPRKIPFHPPKLLLRLPVISPTSATRVHVYPVVHLALLVVMP